MSDALRDRTIVPFVGDLATAAVGFRIVALAIQLETSPLILARMISNLALDVLIGIVPFVGPVCDIFSRANLLNLKLLMDDIARRRTSSAKEAAENQLRAAS